MIPVGESADAAALYAVCRGIGMPVVNQRHRSAPTSEPYWDGRILWYDGFSATLLAHEIGHFLEASEEQRREVNYDLDENDAHREETAEQLARAVELTAVILCRDWIQR